MTIFQQSRQFMSITLTKKNYQYPSAPIVFFKNPILSADDFQVLKEAHPDIPNYPAGSNVKIPAGWLIEQAGWKGKKQGNVGCYEKQALVLVNLGGAKGEEVWSLAQDIIKSVDSKFAIQLSPEVNLWA